METPLRGRSGGHIGAAPTILQHISPFCKGENKNFNARSNAASDKMQKTMLAVTLQALKRKKQCSQ